MRKFREFWTMFSEYLLCLMIPLTTMIMSKLIKKIFHYSEKCRLEDKNNNNIINHRSTMHNRKCLSHFSWSICSWTLRITEGYTTSSGLEPVSTGSGELMVGISSQLFFPWCHVGSLKLPTMGDIYSKEINKYKSRLSFTITP